MATKKITKKQLLSLKGENKLKNYVINDIVQHDDVLSYMQDVLNHGCISGMVSSLIYYNDTVRFYKKYQNEINDIIKELIFSCGSFQDLGLRNWDNDDPLALDTNNQNILAWLGYEETLREIYQNDLELEY